MRLVTILCLLQLAGCGILSSLSPLESLDTAVANQEKKMKMLSQALDHYNRSIYWGDLTAARVYLHPEIASKYARRLHKRSRKEKLTEISIDEITFDQSGDVATVDLAQKYIQKGQIMVRERFEQMTWKFHRFDNGWAAHAVREIDQDGTVISELIGEAEASENSAQET